MQIVNYFTNGDVDKLQALLEKNPTFDINSYAKDGFCLACKSGNIKMAQWLLEMYKPSIDISGFPSSVSKYMNCHVDVANLYKDAYDKAFADACAGGHKKVAEWLLTVKSDLDISANNETAFLRSCERGYLQVAQWLYNLKPTINMSMYEDGAFVCACAYGHLEVAKWLLSVNPKINISTRGDEPFTQACAHGQIEIAKWLLSLKPSIDLSASECYGFKLACVHGHIDIVKWLLLINPSIDIRIKNDYAYIEACRYGMLEPTNTTHHIEVAKFLQSLLPDKYELVVENNKIKSYAVLC